MLRCQPHGGGRENRVDHHNHRFHPLWTNYRIVVDIFQCGPIRREPTKQLTELKLKIASKPCLKCSEHSCIKLNYIPDTFFSLTNLL